MKDTVKKVLGAVLVLMVVVYLLVTAIMDLTNKEDIRTINIDECFEILEVEHSINGLIPVGKDHYYLGVDDDTYDAVIITASAGWYSKNFDENGTAVQDGGITVTSLAKRVSDYKVRDELVARASQLESLNYIVPPQNTLVLNYKVSAILKLSLIILAGVLVAAGAVITKREDLSKGVAGKLLIVGVVVFLILLLIVIL